MSLYLGLDCSTQSFTAIVIEVDGGDRRVVFSHALSFDDDFPEYRTTAGVWRGSDPRHVSSSPVMWAAALDRLLGIVATAPEVDPTRIRAISGSAQQHGSVYFSTDGTAALGRLDGSQPLAPQLASKFSRPASPVWMDESTTDQCRAIESALGGAEATVRLTGSRAHERFTGPQIRRFFETEPDAYARTGSIHLVSSYLASLLVGGNAAIDAGDGSGMTLMDLGAGAWSDSALRATAPDLAARLPSLVPSSSAAGTLSTYWQQRHGLPPATVVAWTGDNPSSLVGTGNVRDDGMAISLGTSDTVFALTPDRHSGATHTFAAPMGGYMALVCFRNGSLARERVRDQHGLDWIGFANALEATHPGNDGALMLPWFEPEITPHVAEPGAHLIGIDERDAARHVRAVVEGQMIAMANHSRAVTAGRRRIIATGGASTSRAILQVMADVFAADVFALPVSNTACLGAGLRALHFDRAAGGEPLSWSEAVAGFTEPRHAAAPVPASVVIYDGLKQRYAELEAKILGVRGRCKEA
jgi:xylulokinase